MRNHLFSTFRTLILLKSAVMTLCWFLDIIMQIFQLMNENSKHFYLFIDLQIHLLCNGLQTSQLLGQGPAHPATLTMMVIKGWIIYTWVLLYYNYICAN